MRARRAARVDSPIPSDISSVLITSSPSHEDRNPTTLLVHPRSATTWLIPSSAWRLHATARQARGRWFNPSTPHRVGRFPKSGANPRMYSTHRLACMALVQDFTEGHLEPDGPLRVFVRAPFEKAQVERREPTCWTTRMGATRSPGGVGRASHYSLHNYRYSSRSAFP
jgi:hypothetical protein